MAHFALETALGIGYVYGGHVIAQTDVVLKAFVAHVASMDKKEAND